ncbi:MAG TPA: hypothetical protein VKR24_09970, partial [Candidatus Limnocylindrales bacterium]|nr:hypothetical protein [Candidatus Limnocylindrales bacterium]
DVPSAVVSPGASGPTSGWTGTMTGTEKLTRQQFSGTTTATFTGTWMPIPLDDPIQLCQPAVDTCVAYFPEGTIHWTWETQSDSPACSSKKNGDAAAGSGNDPASSIFGETLYLQPDAAGGFTYWGDGIWKTPQLDCRSAELGSPPEYFSIPQDITTDTGAKLCHEVTPHIDATATTISGDCFGFNTPGHTLEYTWNLTKVGAPGS